MFYGLDQLDERIARHVTEPRGVFVELGAFDGISQSNTLHFEERGWRGVLIEPVPAAFEACKRNRPLAQVFHAACVGSRFLESFVDIVSVGLMSLAVGSLGGGTQEEEWIRRGEQTQGLQRQHFRVPARTLDSILDEARVKGVDLLVLDVEGAELDVLDGFDLVRWRPRFIVCEDRYDAGVMDYLAARGYRAAVLLERRFTRDVLYSLSPAR